MQTLTKNGKYRYYGMVIFLFMFCISTSSGFLDKSARAERSRREVATHERFRAAERVDIEKGMVYREDLREPLRDMRFAERDTRIAIMGNDRRVDIQAVRAEYQPSETLRNERDLTEINNNSMRGDRLVRQLKDRSDMLSRDARLVKGNQDKRQNDVGHRVPWFEREPIRERISTTNEDSSEKRHVARTHGEDGAREFKIRERRERETRRENERSFPRHNEREERLEMERSSGKRGAGLEENSRTLRDNTRNTRIERVEITRRENREQRLVKTVRRENRMRGEDRIEKNRRVRDDVRDVRRNTERNDDRSEERVNDHRERQERRQEDRFRWENHREEEREERERASMRRQNKRDVEEIRDRDERMNNDRKEDYASRESRRESHSALQRKDRCQERNERRQARLDTTLREGSEERNNRLDRGQREKEIYALNEENRTERRNERHTRMLSKTNHLEQAQISNSYTVAKAILIILLLGQMVKNADNKKVNKLRDVITHAMNKVF